MLNPGSGIFVNEIFRPSLGSIQGDIRVVNVPLSLRIPM